MDVKLAKCRHALKLRLLFLSILFPPVFICWPFVWARIMKHEKFRNYWLQEKTHITQYLDKFGVVYCTLCFTIERIAYLNVEIDLITVNLLRSVVHIGFLLKKKFWSSRIIILKKVRLRLSRNIIWQFGNSGLQCLNFLYF